MPPVISRHAQPVRATAGVGGARAVLAWVLLCACAAALARPPDFPAPPRADVSLVARDMVVQGRRMSVRVFLAEDPVEDIVAYYHDLWREPPVRGAPGVAYEPEALAPWHVLTRVEAGYVMTVQVQPSNTRGSYGYLALGRLPEPGDRPLPEPPAPPAMDGSHIQSNVTSDDRARRRRRCWSTLTRYPATSASTAITTTAGAPTSIRRWRTGTCTRWRSGADDGKSSSPSRVVVTAHKWC